jgi:uncharacterized protein (DUF885 family)
LLGLHAGPHHQDIALVGIARVAYITGNHLEPPLGPQEPAADLIQAAQCPAALANVDAHLYLLVEESNCPLAVPRVQELEEGLHRLYGAHYPSVLRLSVADRRAPAVAVWRGRPVGAAGGGQPGEAAQRGSPVGAAWEAARWGQPVPRVPRRATMVLVTQLRRASTRPTPCRMIPLGRAPLTETVVPFVSRIEDRRPTPGTPFERLFYRFLDEVFAAYPTFATQAGDHRFDHRWPDFSEAGRSARVSLLGRWRRTFGSLHEAQLGEEERVDRSILIEAVDGLLFDEDELRPLSWDPLEYVGHLGTGLFQLLGREFAPWSHRGVALAQRVAGIPAVVKAARENLVGLPGRPVSRLHAETALEQLDGVVELIDEALAVAARRRGEEGGTQVQRRLEAAAPGARVALEAYRTFVSEEVLPAAEGEGRLGAELFDRKLRHTLGSDLGRQEIVSRARRDAVAVRAEMVRLARRLWGPWVGSQPMPVPPPGGGRAEVTAAERAIVRRVLEAIASEHQTPQTLLAFCTAEVDRIARFLRRTRLLHLPSEPLAIGWTPTFLRAYGGAFLDSPGPLDTGQRSHFWITPPGADWTAEQIESSLREDNDRMLRLLCMHEAIPGHYLQLARANRCPSLVRSIFSSGVFAEGWALYMTQLMMDMGYGRRDPALRLIHWKFYLRAVLNALLDAGVHADGMTEDEALSLLIETGFQEEQEARSKFLRARLTAAQLSTYYVGSQEMWDLELEARRRAAAACGAPPDAVPRPRLVGRLGASPGFDQRAHLEAVLAHGTPPPRWLRRILFGGGQASER